MARSERLLAILQAVRGRRLPITARELASTFGVSARTIYRDIATLAAQGAVIEGCAGFGYVLRSDYFLPPLTLSADEAAALILGLRFAEARGDDALASGAASARRKLEAVAKEMSGEGGQLARPLLVGPAAPSSNLSVVRRALRSHRKLRIEYVDENRRGTRRTVWPVAIGFFDGCELLAAWCETRSAFRHFRLDRICSSEVAADPPGRDRRQLLAEYRVLEPGIAPDCS